MTTADHYAIKPWKFFRHPVSGFTHLAGALFGFISLIFMIRSSLEKQDPWHLSATLIFGLSLSLLYSTSSFYHLTSLSEKATQLFRRLDHSMIYIFIAGCYTPFCLVSFRESVGIKMAILIWALAFVGVGTKVFWLESSRWIRISLYFVLSSVCVFLIPHLWNFLGVSGFLWLMGGGAAYILGAVIYAIKRPDPFPEVFGFHEIWHLFVLAGTACHFWVITHYVLS